MKELLLATQNKNKVTEIQAILSQVGYHVVSAADVPAVSKLDVEETGKTYAENSELKAVAFGIASGMLALADDSGLSVAALNGRPGVYSKRYAPGSDFDRNEVVLTELEGELDRGAAFITDLCLYDPKTGKTLHFEGKVDGQISTGIKGEHGFGYDPIFIPEGYGQTFAELGSEVKNQLSHRARALAKVKAYLSSHT